MSSCQTDPRWLPLVTLVASLLMSSGSPAQEKGKALPEDLALVGAAPAFIRFDIGRPWNGPEAATLRKVCQAHPVVWLWEGHGIEKRLGLQWPQVDRAVIIIGDFKNTSDAIIVLTTREPFDRDKLIGALVPDGKEVKVKEQSYITSEKAGVAAHVLSKQALVIGGASGVKAFLTNPPAKPDALKEALTAAAAKPLLAVGFDPRSFAAAVENAGEKGKPFLPLFRARSWQLTADGKDDLLVQLRFTFADEATAKEAVPAAAAAATPLDWYLGLTEKEFPEFFKREAKSHPGAAALAEPLLGTIQALRAALKDFKPEQEGAVVRGSLRIKTKTPATALLMLATLLPRAAK